MGDYVAKSREPWLL